MFPSTHTARQKRRLRGRRRLPWTALASLLVAGCGQGGVQQGLVLEGPAQVRVTELGPVEGPRALLSDGSEPGGLVWSADPASVAVVEHDAVRAVGPGKATITARWNEQSVQWTLLVQPVVSLHFVDPPPGLTIGDEVALRVVGRLGERVVEPGEVLWHSSDDAVLNVAGGRAVGRAAGMAWVTAESRDGSRATLQLQVVDR